MILKLYTLFRLSEHVCEALEIVQIVRQRAEHDCGARRTYRAQHKRGLPQTQARSLGNRLKTQALLPTGK